MSIQYQNRSLQKVHLCQTRVIAYSAVGLLNLKSEVFKFLLLLCEGVYFVFLRVVGNDTQNQDATEEVLPMSSICPRRTFEEAEAWQILEGLSVCLSARVLFGWGLCSSLPPPRLR